MPNKYDFYLKLMEIILENVEQYSKDAILLRDNLSFGHAYSMAILGFEELAKCWFAFELFIGEIERDDEIASKITSDHLTKQILGWQILSQMIVGEWYENSIYRSEIDNLSKQLQKGEMDLETYTRKFYGYAERECINSVIAQNVMELTEVIKKLDSDNLYMIKRKNEGFYVDFDLSKLKITSTPDKFALSDVIFIDTFVGFYQFSKEIIQTIKDNLQRKTVKEIIENMRKGFKLIREEIMKIRQEEHTD